MKAILYVVDGLVGRVALAGQEEACRQLCHRYGWDVEVLFGGRSGDGMLEQAVREAQRPERVLVTYSASVLAETQGELLGFLFPQEGGRPFPVAFVLEGAETASPAGRAAAAMLRAWASLPRARGSVGGKPGAPSMSETAPAAVERVVALHKQGLSLRAIAEKLNVEGVMGGRGGSWYPKTVRAALAQAEGRKGKRGGKKGKP